MNAEGAAPLTGATDPGTATAAGIHGLAEPEGAPVEGPGADGDSSGTAVVTMSFDASDPDALLAALSKYVVLARGEPGCRNVDLCTSFTRSSRFVIIEKWDSTQQAQSHFDSDLMVEMARACQGVLGAAPEIDLLEGLSAHDLA